MKIYTRTGDTGDTSLFGGKRVPKSSLRIDVYGTIDELNTQLGIVRALKPQEEVGSILEQLQSQLFILGSDLAAPLDVTLSNVERIGQDQINSLEKIIDRLEIQLEPLKTFIIPGGSYAGSQLHVARAVCRRAERLAVALGRKEEINRFSQVYLNRLADLLFVLARYENKISGIEEIKWRGNTDK